MTALLGPVSNLEILAKTNVDLLLQLVLSSVVIFHCVFVFSTKYEMVKGARRNFRSVLRCKARHDFCNCHSGHLLPGPHCYQSSKVNAKEKRKEKIRNMNEKKPQL